MASELEQVFLALDAANVRYLVVGGVAVVLHGHLRATADLDLVVDLDEANATHAIGALEGMGFRPRAPVQARDFAKTDVREAWVQDKGMRVFSMWNPDLPGFEIDLFVREPFVFSEVYARAVRVQLPDCEVPVISREDLIVLKREAGRPRDIEDIAALQALGEEDG